MHSLSLQTLSIILAARAQIEARLAWETRTRCEDERAGRRRDTVQHVLLARPAAAAGRSTPKAAQTSRKASSLGLAASAARGKEAKAGQC